MIRQAQLRGFAHECVLFDSWYSSPENLKLVRDIGWTWLTRLKSNRIVNLNCTGQQPLAEVELSAAGAIVYLKGYGLIKIFKIVTLGGNSEFWATNDLTMDELTRLRLAENAWAIEHYPRGIKQYCGIERAQVRAARAQRNILAWPSVLSYASKPTTLCRASLGARPNSTSFATLSVPTLPIQPIRLPLLRDF